MNLVVIPFHDWKKCEQEGFRTRDAHFMEEFARHPLVDKMLVIDRPTSLAETLLLGKNWSVRGGSTIAATATTRISKVSEKTYIFNMRTNDLIQPLLLKRKWVPLTYGKHEVVKSVREALNTLGMASSYVVFMSAPLYVPLASKLTPSVLTLDAQDNLLKHSLYKDTPKLAEYYQYCRDHADVIYTNSVESMRWLGENRSEVYYIGNGVDSHTMDASRTYPIPNDIIPLKSQPIIGYAGKMQEMVDVELVERLVVSLPNVNFVFVGQILRPQWVKRLWQYPNVHHLGDKNYKDLPAYLSAFDICIIPYSVERQHGGDPIKFYEYLAMGKPIVTTKIGGVGEFSDYHQVCIANSSEEFLNGLSHFLQKLANREKIEKKPVPEVHTWKHKVNSMIEKLESIYTERNGL